MRSTLLILLTTISSYSVTMPAAAQPTDVMSCYDALNLQAFKPVQSGRHLVVIVDQTARLDDPLKKSVHQQVDQFIEPGDQVQIVAFSANAKGKYTDIVYNGQFDQQLSSEARNNIGKVTLNKFDACMKSQPKAKGKLHQRLRTAFGEEQATYPKTELVGSLFQISADLLSTLGENRKVVLIVSDMLENSNITSFYANNGVRQIEPEIEISKFDGAGISANFADADVYVIGAGFTGNGMAYSSQQALSSLESFWQKIFEKSNANLKQFGKPQLLSQML